MRRNLGMRQIHRWVSMAFTVAVIAVTIIVLVQEHPAAWVYFSPLPPLALLLLTGLYLFALPYLSRRRGRPRSVPEA